MKRTDMVATRGKARWAQMAAREQRLLLVASALVVAALLWWVALAPALRTLRSAPAEHARLDAQLQQMTTLQTQAKALQSQPRASRDEALRSLETSVRQNLGANAQLQAASAGDGANIQMRAAPAENLAEWFGQARSNARAIPREAHLTRSAAATGADAAKVRWDGTLVMSLPAR